MGDDWIMSVYDGGVVSSLVEHAQIHSQYGGIVHVTMHGALIRADHHETILVVFQIGENGLQFLQDLVIGDDIIESHQRYGVLYHGLVCVEGQQVGDAHVLEFLQHDGTVQGLAEAALVLTSAIQDRHDDGDTVSLASYGLDDPLQILIMIVRRHMILIAKQVVGAPVIAYIYEDVQVSSTYGLIDDALGIAGLETGAGGFNDHGRSVISFPFSELAVDLGGQFLSSLCCNQSDTAIIAVVFQYVFGSVLHSFHSSHFSQKQRRW